MTNEELLEKAREVGFDTDDSGFTTASDGKTAVLLPRQNELISRLEAEVPTLKCIDNRFHYWVVRA